jgi:hypothetical protein
MGLFYYEARNTLQFCCRVAGQLNICRRTCLSADRADSTHKKPAQIPCGLCRRVGFILFI